MKKNPGIRVKNKNLKENPGIKDLKNCWNIFKNPGIKDWTKSWDKCLK